MELKRLVPKGDFIVACLTVLFSLAQFLGDIGHEPTLFALFASSYPFVIIVIAAAICLKTEKQMPWYGLAFMVCTLSMFGILLLPYTLGIPHIFTLVMALKRKNYLTVSLVAGALVILAVVIGTTDRHSYPSRFKKHASFTNSTG